MDLAENEKISTPRESEEINDGADRWTHASYRKYLVSRIEAQQKMLKNAQTIRDRVAILDTIDRLTDRLYQLDIKTRQVKFVIGDKEF